MTDVQDSALDSLTSWLIVALGVLLLVLVWGIVFTFTVYSQALESAFGLTSLRVSSVFSITTAAFYVAGGAIGVVIARVPLRPVVAAAGVVFATAVALLQVSASYPGLVLAFGLLGTAGGTVFVVVISLVPQWFDEYQGRAMGVTMTGNGLGVFALPPVWLWLLERTSIRGAFVVVGGATVGVILLASLLYRRPPGRRGTDVSPVDSTWLRSNLTDRAFLASLAGFALIWSWYFVLSADFVGILTENGIRRTLAATAFGIVGGVSVAARVASGEFADRIGMRVTLAAGVALAALGMVALPLVTTPLPMYALLVCFGVGLGAVAPLFSPIIIERFGPANATAIVGIFTVAEATTAFSIPIVLNVLTGITGGYAPPLVLIGGLTLLGAWLFYRGTAPQAG
ncbi:MFS transporter [Halobellus rarus]|uniref:Nitrate/nitrite transporter n=1 Tax=Halobellus rarus TaxID=1126237 RepID=A0ABD6CRS5_9EURY|nr:MFS transporter [Halobellus rarus]